MSAVMTCPKWCETKHIPENKWGEESELHEKHFGDPEGAHASAWIVYYADGRIGANGFTFNIEESEDPEDMDEVAGWCTAVATFMREIRGTMVTV